MATEDRSIPNSNEHFEKIPYYLSPSSIGQSKVNPNTFYATRLMLEGLPREPTNLAMGTGTHFDIQVKLKILKLGCKLSEGITVQEILDSLQVDDLDLLGQIEECSGQLMRSYKNSKVLAMTKWRQVEGVYDQEYTFMGHTVPLMGKLDAVVWDDEYEMDIPMDWKCSGSNAAGGMSPKPGFMNKWDGKQWKGPHKKYHRNILVTDLPSDWARQFTIYGIMLNEERGIPFGTEFPVMVHHPIFNGKARKPMVATYRAIVTKEQQEKVWMEAVDLWESLKDGSFRQRLVVTNRNKYADGVIADYAEECESFFRPSPICAQDQWLAENY